LAAIKMQNMLTTNGVMIKVFLSVFSALYMLSFTTRSISLGNVQNHTTVF